MNDITTQQVTELKKEMKERFPSVRESIARRDEYTKTIGHVAIL